MSKAFQYWWASWTRAAANIFVGQVEAPLLIRPYVSKLSNKELLILMTAGMATVAGSVMVALIAILESFIH